MEKVKGKRGKRKPKEIKVIYGNKYQPGTLEKIFVDIYVQKFKNGEPII
jgi:hypothetical protein